jgi:hypothetical protein
LDPWISLLALLALLYQLYLQRVHNEKSLSPLPQIVLSDHEKKIYVHLRNNGVGPLRIENTTFTKNGISYSGIEDCLDLNPKSYMHDSEVSESMRHVVLPGYYLEIFSTRFEESAGDDEIENVRQQLAPITLKVNCRDVYDNKITIERNWLWFSRLKASKEDLT